MALKKMQKVFALLMALSMTATIASVTALADDQDGWANEKAAVEAMQSLTKDKSSLLGGYLASDAGATRIVNTADADSTAAAYTVTVETPKTDETPAADTTETPKTDGTAEPTAEAAATRTITLGEVAQEVNRAVAGFVPTGKTAIWRIYRDPGRVNLFFGFLSADGATAQVLLNAAGTWKCGTANVRDGVLAVGGVASDKTYGQSKNQTFEEAGKPAYFAGAVTSAKDQKVTYRTPSAAVTENGKFDYKTKNGNADYTLTENAAGRVVVTMNLFDLLGKAQAAAYNGTQDATSMFYAMPGDVYTFDCSFLNSSTHNFAYVPGSLTVAPGQYEDGSAARGFDGQNVLNGLKAAPVEIPDYASMSYAQRVQALAEKFGDGTNDLTKLSAAQMQKLARAAYASRKNAKGYDDAISEFANNAFYQYLLGIRFDGTPLSAGGKDDEADTVRYSMASYMKGAEQTKDAGDAVLAKAFADFQKGGKVDLKGISIAINAYMTTNLWAGYGFTGYLSFELQQTDTSYTVMGNYFTNGIQDNKEPVTLQKTAAAAVGSTLTAVPAESWASYQGGTYVLDTAKSLVSAVASEDAAKNVLTLNYYRTQSSDIVVPTPEPKPVTPEPVVVTDPTVPTTETPDTKIPDAEVPETPTAEVPDTKTPAAEIPDGTTPKASVPKTGDNTLTRVSAACMAASLAGLVLVSVCGKRKKAE